MTKAFFQNRLIPKHFPGCNVYFQPEKLLNALDIMDAIGDDYSFLPGLDYCCSDSHLFFGAVKEGGKKAEELITALSEFNPKTVILWCPTCHCRFKTTLSLSMKIPFKVISFPQYLAENMHKLQLTDAAAGTVTLHEGCKSAYTGVDINGPRDVLKRLPGVNLVEMAHYGRNTMCCGSGAMTWFPDSCKHIRKQRLDEAGNTGADRLVTICHYCSQTFVTEEPAYDFSVDNFVNLVALSMGIHRQDKFKQYTLWADRDMIVKDAQARIASSPFAKKEF
nr:(Fe-S)-binding protein [Desulfobacter hydrogenophilus]